MTLDELDRWLDAYGRAWERHELDEFVRLFAEDAVYQWGPWGDTLRDHDDNRARALEAISKQGAVSFGHEPLAITPDGRGIARWWASIEMPDDNTIEENEGIFLVTLGADGRCTDFREWWNSRTRPAG